jgi:hypothetical protein
MPYRIISFDDVRLPEYNPVDPLSTGEVPSSLADTLNGSVDFWGNTRRLPRSQPITFKGMYVAERGLIVDHLGRTLIDPKRATIPAVTNGTDPNNMPNPPIPGHDNDRAIISTDLYFADLRTRTDALKGRLGYLARLRRQPEDERIRAMNANEVAKANIRQIIKTDPTNAASIKAETDKLVNIESAGLQWKLARLLSVKHDRTLGDINRVANIEANFETTMTAWKSEQLTFYPASGKATSTGSIDAEVSVAGSEVINDCVIRLWPSAPLRRFSITANGITVRWNYTEDLERIGAPNLHDPIPVGSEIVIDMGKETITGIVGDLYTNFHISTVSPGWLSLLPGTNTVKIDSAGVGLLFTVEYYNQWT